ncbi:nitrite reductase [Pandoraea vervacti]|uniref:Nitrite reductase n=1 Tax=Pandoraea vervacti TaxID=656178 RepID=A0ABM6FRM0_9BURK|nr:nitrite reductase small subunit NirD [Pandoraea vervacti]APD11509.1 nitrite reductase [Pandoraea vervacti]
MEPCQPTWLHVCDVNAIPRLGSRVLTHSSGDIALFRTESDSVFALRDQCPHKGGALSQGIVHGEKVTCPLHAWNLDLRTGEACAPDVGCAQRFPVRIDAGEVYLSFDETGRDDAAETGGPADVADGVTV